MRSLDELKKDINEAALSGGTQLLRVLAEEALTHGTKEAYAIAEHIYGLVATRTGDAPSALMHFQNELTLREELNDRRSIARAYGNIGNKYLNMGEGATALTHFQRALSIMEELDDRIGVARSLGNIGNVYTGNGEYGSAMEYYHRSMALHTELENRSGVANVVGNIGTLHLFSGEYAEALAYYHRALDMHEELAERSDVARILNSMGNVYESLGDYPRSVEHYRHAMEIFEELGDRNGVAMTVANIGLVHADTGEHASALEQYRQAMSVYEELNDRPGAAVVMGNMGSVYGSMGEHTTALEYFRRALSMCQELGDRSNVTRVMGRIITALLSNGEDTAARDVLEQQSALVIDNPEVRTERLLNMATLCERAADLEGSLDHLCQALSVAADAGLRAQVAECHKRLRDLAQQRNNLADYIEHNNEFTRITEEIRGKEATQRLAMMEAERKVEGERRERDKERALLYGTLPKNIADRMIRGEKVSGDHYDEATVIFADIVGFTQISESIPPGEVVQLLEQIFTAFDAICEKHGVTKIKTIGDSYMAVAFDGVVNAALCALEMSRFRISHSVSHSVSHNVSHSVSHSVSHEVAFRIGMHFGPVTAGVIGTQRLQYDVWGDTVNLASRLESTGEAGRCQISRAVVDAIESRFRDQEPDHESGIKKLIVNHEFKIEERGEIEIKGKGMMRMYWLEAGEE
ncbi:MAG: tetratricopeptide repeat protein [Bacteroidetes bacterium]|nr:tetratricopeptide repeat protein [Bacteroidota bacterium]